MTEKKKRRAKKQKKPFRERPSSEKFACDRLLYGRDRRGSRPIYEDSIHPDDIVAFFRIRYEKIQDAERYATEHRLDYVAEPIRPPTLSAYAAHIGVGRRTIWSWIKKYPAFDEAVDECQAMQEAAVIELSAIGAYNAGFAALMMKNLHQWQDKVEATHRGEVHLHFDAQDKDA